MDSREELLSLIEARCSKEGLNDTLIPGVRCLKFSATTPVRIGPWPKSFVIVAQGQKEITLLKRPRLYKEAHYLATPIDLMVESRVKVRTAESPYLALLLDLNVTILADLVSSMAQEGLEKPKASVAGIYAGAADEKMLNAAIRLLSLNSNLDECRILAPMIIRELHFHLLKTSNGFYIQQFALASSTLRKISVAVADLKANLQKPIDIDAMASKANMSRTTFFRAFKEHTSISPVQFLKRLRLNEARQLLQQQGESAERTSYLVGYKSASQFSREYTDYFGKSPKRDAHGV